MTHLIPENARTKHIGVLGTTGSGKTSAVKVGLVEPLPEGERRVLEILISAWPDPVDRERISEATDYKRSSRDTYLQRLTARELIHHAHGGPAASPDLFD